MCCGFGTLSQLSWGRGKETVADCGIFMMTLVWFGFFKKPEAIQIMTGVISFSQKNLSTAFDIFLGACVSKGM